MLSDGARLKAGLPLLLGCLAGCAVTPCYNPIPDGVMKKLEKQVRSAQELGVQRSGAGVSFAATVNGPAATTLSMSGKSVLPHIPCRLHPGKDPVSMIFDTGAQISVIDAETALRNDLGIIDPKTTNVTVVGVLGREKMIAGIASPMGVGRCELTKHLLLVRTHRNETRWLGPIFPERIGIDLLGFDLARQWCRYVSFDYLRRKVTFGFKEDFRPKKGPRAWELPLVIEGGMPFLVLESRGIQWLALIDTGSAFGVEIDEGLAAELDVLKTSKPVDPGMINTAIGGMEDANKAGIRLAMLKTLNGLGPAHKDAEIAISPGGPRVGSFFFKDYKLTIDLARQKVWLER